MLLTSFTKLSEAGKTTTFAYEHFPEEDAKQKSLGRIFVVLDLVTFDQDSAVAPLEQARVVYSDILSFYYESTTKPFDALKATLEKVAEKYGAAVKIGAAVYARNVFYTATVNGLSVYILREGSLVQIITGTEKTVIASGHPKATDTVFVGSTNFFETFAPKIPAVFAREHLEKSAGLFSSLVEGDQFAIVIGFSEGAEDESLNVVTTPLVQKSAETFDTVVAESDPEEVNRPSIVQKIPFSKIPFKLTSWLKRDKQKIKVEEVFETVEEIKKRRTTMLVAGILLFLLLVSILFGLRQKLAREKVEAYQDRLTQAIHNFEEAEKLGSLNPSRSRELFIQAKDSASQLVAEGIEDEQLTALMDQINQKEGKILGEYNIESKLFVDLKLIGDNMDAVDLAGADEDFAVLDIGGERVIRVSFSDKNTKVIAGPSQVGQEKILAYYPPNGYILSKDGVYSVGTEKEDIADLENGKLIYAYAANLYVLGEDSDIYRLSSISGGFANPSKWLAEDQELDLGSAVSWAIDGSVWIALAGGDIVKLTQGFKENFSYSAPSEVQNPTSIYTNEEAESLYLLDAQNKRVVAVNKEGDFIAQYKSDQLQEALDIVVSEQEKLIIFLTKDKLYSIELKHLE